MEQRSEELWRLARTHARRFLCRFEDSFTRAECDDLVQESAVAAWQWAGAAREPIRFAAAVRTIARRKRFRALREHYRRRDDLPISAEFEEPPAGCDYVVAGRRVPRDWIMARLCLAMRRLPTLDRRVLQAHQEGFCCAEIATRLDLKEESVRVRLHRARRRVRIEIERAVTATDTFDLP